MTAEGEPLHTGRKQQSDGECRQSIANKTGELVPNRKHHQFSLYLKLLQGAFTAFFVRCQLGHGNEHGTERSGKKCPLYQCRRCGWPATAPASTWPPCSRPLARSLLPPSQPQYKIFLPASMAGLRRNEIDKPLLCQFLFPKVRLRSETYLLVAEFFRIRFHFDERHCAALRAVSCRRNPDDCTLASRLERSNLPGMPTKSKPVSKFAQKPPKSKAASLVVSSSYPASCSAWSRSCAARSIVWARRGFRCSSI